MVKKKKKKRHHNKKEQATEINQVKYSITKRKIAGAKDIYKILTLMCLVNIINLFLIITKKTFWGISIVLIFLFILNTGASYIISRSKPFKAAFICGVIQFQLIMFTFYVMSAGDLYIIAPRSKIIFIEGYILCQVIIIVKAFLLADEEYISCIIKQSYASYVIIDIIIGVVISMSFIMLAKKFDHVSLNDALNRSHSHIRGSGPLAIPTFFPAAAATFSGALLVKYKLAVKPALKKYEDKLNGINYENKA